jgi:hypothetical protein
MKVPALCRCAWLLGSGALLLCTLSLVTGASGIRPRLLTDDQHKAECMNNTNMATAEQSAPDRAPGTWCCCVSLQEGHAVSAGHIQDTSNASVPHDSSLKDCNTREICLLLLL